MANTPITALPDGFNPSAMYSLNLTNTPISSLPESILSLSRNCTIYITITNFSDQVRNNLQERTQEQNYRGPRFEYNNADTNYNSMPELDLKQTLDLVLEKAEVEDIDTKALLDSLSQGRSNKDRANLKTWLNRLFQTASAKSERNKQYFKSIVETIKHAADDDEMKTIFYIVLETASTTCGDRVALSALHFDIQRQLAKLDTSNPNEVYDFLINCVFIMDKLEKLATNFVPTMFFTDPLEVYLGLPVKLKEEYNIPINIENMLFFGCSGLRDEHLNQARAVLDTDLQNEDTLFNFLIEQPKWLKVLDALHPDEMSALTKVKEEEAVDPETAESALQNYQSGLRALTVKVKSTFV